MMLHSFAGRAHPPSPPARWPGDPPGRGEIRQVGLCRGGALLGAAMLGAVMFLLGAVVSPPASAQASNGAGKGDRLGCVQEPHAAATPPAHGPSSGTAPGGAGGTGWSGGTGGSYIGTTPQAPTPSSPTEHPQTVQGLDPRPEPPRRSC